MTLGSEAREGVTDGNRVGIAVGVRLVTCKTVTTGAGVVGTGRVITCWVDDLGMAAQPVEVTASRMKVHRYAIWDIFMLNYGK